MCASTNISMPAVVIHHNGVKLPARYTVRSDSAAQVMYIFALLYFFISVYTRRNSK